MLILHFLTNIINNKQAYKYVFFLFLLSLFHYIILYFIRLNRKCKYETKIISV